MSQLQQPYLMQSLNLHKQNLKVIKGGKLYFL